MNEGKTNDDINEQGERLAEEVKQYILEYCPGKNLEKLSFVGHSMGGLICRAAFPLLSQYQDRFHTFCTFGSPHMGYMYKSTKLFNTGMWIFRKWNKQPSLSQMAMDDHTVVEQSFIYKLSEKPGL